MGKWFFLLFISCFAFANSDSTLEPFENPDPASAVAEETDSPLAETDPSEPIAKFPDPAKSPFCSHLRPRSSTNPPGVGLVARTAAARLPLANGRKNIDFSGAGSFATGSRVPSLPKLCLHMILKNEAHVIRRCLDSVMPLIDYWVIVDTGSSDGTQEIVLDYLKDIPGELHEIPWKNWGETRSEAIALARNKAEYILLMDADDILAFDGNPELPELTKDQYCMWRGSTSFTYQRPQIVKGDLPWRYVGVTHEYLDCPVPFESEMLETVKYVTLDDGAESRDLKQKFLKNIRLLEEGLQKEPENGRYAFYLAESYRCADEKGKAMETYQKRIRMGGWDQELFWSKLQIAHILRDLKFPTNVILEAYKDAHAFRPHRSEPVYYMAELLNQEGRYEEAYKALKSYALIPQPERKDALFNVDWIEDYGLLFQLSISAYYANHFEESLDACDTLLENDHLPESWRALTLTNRTYPIQKLKAKIEQEL